MLIKETLANPDSLVPYCHCPSIVLTPAGVSIYNCSPDTNLDCFERVTLEWVVMQ